MAEEEAESATEIKFFNVTFFLYSTYSSSSGLCENGTKYMGRNSQFSDFTGKKKHKTSEEL